MPLKKKRLFTRHNSTKFVLIAEERVENDKKITQNVLVPVRDDRVAGSSLLLPNLPEPCGMPLKTDSENVDLTKILSQMSGTDGNEDSDDENYKKTKLNRRNFFSESDSFFGPYSNVQVKIFEEDEDDFPDDLHQFSDVSDEDFDNFDNFQNKNALTSRKPDCPETIKLLNEGFQKVLLEYTDNQIGALDDEEICGTFTTENEQMINFISTPLEKNPEDIVIGELEDELKEKVLLYAEVEMPDKVVEIITEKPIDFDCESIASTYSNIYNHPTIIKEKSKIQKIKIFNPLKRGLTKSKLKQLESVSEEEEEEEEDERLSIATSCNVRIKGETPEQRRERKKLFKELKRESRKLKKENKLAFKKEKKLQVAQALNVQNTRCIKLF